MKKNKKIFWKSMSMIFIGLIICLIITFLQSMEYTCCRDFYAKNKIDKLKKSRWHERIEEVNIKSKIDNSIQKAFFYKSNSSIPGPLIISLHTWSENYKTYDSISNICMKKNITYLRPNYRGANNNPEACMSELALHDIDQAIAYGLKNANIDSSKIFIIGSSGGGYAALSTFMKSSIKISRFSVWCPITDLEAWYEFSLIKKNKYPDQILKCTKSKNGKLDLNSAKKRSPMHWPIPMNKIGDVSLNIYVGINDGINGSVPITQSINFYNKLLVEYGGDKSNLVTDNEKLLLLEHRKALGNYGELNGRKICLIKKFEDIKLVIFKGNHEIMENYAVENLLRE